MTMDVTFEGNTATGKDEWLTPPDLIKELGPFDLDPCAPVIRPWDIAAKHYTVEDDGLVQPWEGLVWCNPPYGRGMEVWLEKAALHNNSIVLIFARTGTSYFCKWVWDFATAAFFFKGKLSFHHVNGDKAANSAGTYSVLVAYGEEAAKRLSGFKRQGRYIELNENLL